MASSSCSCGLAMALFGLMVLSSSFGFSSAVVFKVGDAIGWTTLGKIDYAGWASKQTIHVGDTLLFEYNNIYHNVMEVKKSDFDSCTASKPILTLATGNDSITLKSEGEHYFLCGVPGHCEKGQKVKVMALAKGSSAAPSISPAGAPSSEAVTPAKGGEPGTSGGESVPPAASPKSSNAALACKGLGLVVSIVVAGFMIYV